MKRLVPALVAVSATVAACTAGGGAAPGVSGSAPAGAVRAAGPLGRAIAVPGLAALSKGGYARVNSVSCASPGNCAAGGRYGERRNPNTQGFVADERNGRWDTAIEVPGLAAPKTAQGSDVVSVSCGSAGDCAAGAYYYQLPNIVVPVLATERGGLWGKAVTLPAGALPGDGSVNSVSCASAGNCLAGGGIAGNNQYFVTGDAFVVQERAGRWGPVTSLPGLRALEHGGDPESAGSLVNSVACPSAGDCTAGGAYTRHGYQGFVAAEQNGAWGTAIPVPGLAALNTGGDAEVTSVSCASPGNCAAAGYYTVGDNHTQGFVAAERNGAWGPATGVPGLDALNAGGSAEVTSVSCGSAGSCAAVGSYAGGSGHHQGFVAVERNGAWGRATGVPGLAALTRSRGSTQVLTVSCAPAGSCAAGGSYTDSSRHQQGFVAVERNGVWGRATGVPGLAALNAGGSAEVDWLSCASPGKCAAGGFYTDASGQHQGFVTQTG